MSQLWRGYYKTRETIQKELLIEQKKYVARMKIYAFWHEVHLHNKMKRRKKEKNVMNKIRARFFV
jgi:hypothetical protein